MAIYLAILSIARKLILKSSCYRGSNLKAYNYFESGFVRTVFAMGFGNGDQKCCLLKAKVNPIVSALQIRPKKRGSSSLIVFAHCTCMAGFVMIIFPKVHAQM